MTVPSLFHSRCSPSWIVLGCALVIAGVVGGCDLSVEGEETEDAVEISGQATDELSSGGDTTAAQSQQAVPKAAVEGAVITAASVGADGSTGALEGVDTTNANGEFTLEVTGENTDGIVRLTAEGSGNYTSQSLVMVSDETEVRSLPLTGETEGEAQVYVEAKAADSATTHAEGVTPADVTFYVTGGAAADITAGQVNAGEVASALVASIKAERRANASAENGASADAVADLKLALFEELQSTLPAAANEEEQRNVLRAFQDAMGTLYIDAGATAESQAKIRQTSTSVLIELSTQSFGGAGFPVRRQAELLRAQATALAQEAIFEAQGASEQTLTALDSARQEMVAEIRAAESVDAIVSAESAYQSAAKSQMEEAFGVSSLALRNAQSEIDGALEALFTALSQVGSLSAGPAEMAVTAYDTYYSEAQAAAAASLETSVESEGQAEAVARALVLLSALRG